MERRFKENWRCGTLCFQYGFLSRLDCFLFQFEGKERRSEMGLHRASGDAQTKGRMFLPLNWKPKCPQTKMNVDSELLNCGRGESCNRAQFCSEFHSWISSPSMLYRCSSGSKSPRLQPKTFSLLPKIQRECLSCLWFCQYFPQRKNKLQRFCNLFCSVRINACSVGLVIGLRIPHSQHLGGPIANNCLVFQVMLFSCKLPGWPLDAAYKGLFYQSDHTGTRPKCSLIVRMQQCECLL